MTVYKKITLEADTTAQVVALISKGSPITSLAGSTTTKTPDGGTVPSILETSISVDKTNIATTVLADGYVTKSDICQNLPVSVDTNGICS